jgi:Protein of unknown function (DUF2510)
LRAARPPTCPETRGTTNQSARPESYATNYVGNGVTAPLPPPGWYPDPGGANTQRYFDGTEWTDQLAPFRKDPVGRAWLWFLSRPCPDPETFSRAVRAMLVGRQVRTFDPDAGQVEMAT